MLIGQFATLARYARAFPMEDFPNRVRWVPRPYSSRGVLSRVRLSIHFMQALHFVKEVSGHYRAAQLGIDIFSNVTPQSMSYQRRLAGPPSGLKCPA